MDKLVTWNNFICDGISDPFPCKGQNSVHNLNWTVSIMAEKMSAYLNLVLTLTNSYSKVDQCGLPYIKVLLEKHIEH